MIRINLLPQAKRAVAVSAPGSGQTWAIVYAASSLVWGIGLTGVYFTYAGTLSSAQAQNRSMEAQITRVKDQSKGLDAAQAKLAASKSLEEVVGQLNAAKLGPTRAIMELSKILSPGGGPTIDPARLEQLRRDNPLAGYNAGWDTRRVSLESFKEETRECRIEGIGKTNEDVAEFLRRLSLSDLFERVTLIKTESMTDRDSGITLIKFELSSKVKY